MSESRWMALLFAAAFLVRLVSALGSALFGTDSGHFLLMADWFRAGRFDEALGIAYHPMYPLLIAVARTFTGSTEAAGTAVSVLLGSAATMPLYKMAHAFFGRPAAVVAALLYAFNPYIAEVQSEVMTEGTFMFFLFSANWMTWRVLQAPSLERSVVLGLLAAGAYLTRPEGILAIALALACPVLYLVVRREDVLRRAAGIVVTLAAFLLLASPYFLWVKEHRGRWALSPRQSAISAEQELGVTPAAGPAPQQPPPSHYYGAFFKYAFRLTFYGAWIPFSAIGLWTLRRREAVPWFYFLLPLAHLAGILYTLRTHPFMSDRYLMAPVALLAALPALGFVAVFRHLGARASASAWAPQACGALLLVVGILPAIKLLPTRRLELLSYRVAATAILAQDPRPRAMSGPAEQVAYLCGVRSFYAASTHEEIRRQIEANRVDCYVYSERDVTGRQRSHVEMLRTCPFLAPPVEVAGQPGTLKVYYQRSN